jgi:hypothetical protein
MDLEVEYQPGPHKGWDNYWFNYGGQRWSLLVIRDSENPSSQIAREGDSDNPPWVETFWPSFHILSLPVCITPEAAHKIVMETMNAWRNGITQGRKDKVAEFRQWLNH